MVGRVSAWLKEACVCVRKPVAVGTVKAGDCSGAGISLVKEACVCTCVRKPVAVGTVKAGDCSVSGIREPMLLHKLRQGRRGRGH